MQFTKRTTKNTQEKIIFSYLKKRIATNSMIAVSTGIPRASVCKVKRKLETEGKLFEVEQGLCKVSNHKAYFLTTNPNMVKP